MPASYPASIKTFVAKVDAVDFPQAVHVNDLQDEVNAIETELGAAPKTIDDTVAPAASPGSVAVYLDMLANIVKTIGGHANWYTAPVAFVKKAGDTMTGALTLNADPTAALHAATKQYVDGRMDRIAFDVTVAEVVSSVAETTMATLTIPAGTLGSDRTLILEAIGDILNNNAASDDVIVRVKYGATTIASYTLETVATSATRRPIGVRVVLSAANATGAQVAKGEAWVGQNDISGVGGAWATHIVSGHSAVAVDSTVNQDIVITYQLSASSANLSGKLHAAHVYVAN